MAKAKKNKKITPTHKRKGTHQKRTNSFMKTYWPYLPMVGIIGIGLAVNFAINRASMPNVLGTHSSVTESQLVSDSNIIRSKNNIAPLSSNSSLDKAASAKAQDIVNNNYWSHVSKSGKTAWDFIGESGYRYSVAAENLAYGFNSSNEVITGWMNSQEHKNNLLGKNYKEVGFGIATSQNFMGKGYETIVVALYANPEGPQSVSAVGQSTVNRSNQINITNTSQSISWIQMLTKGGAPWSLYFGTVAATILATIFIIKHGKTWHKVLVKSEDFIIHHPMLDSIAVGLVMIDFVLSHPIGTIL